MITYKLHLIRTGRTSGDGQKRYVGQADPPLCEEGRAGLEELLRDCTYPLCERVYTSPLLRCRETAGILYPGQDPVEVPELMDMDFGEFEGLTFDELRDNEAFTLWLSDSMTNTPPGGEATEDFTRRILRGLDRVFREMTADGVEEAAVITHGGVIMAMLAAAGLPQVPLHQWAVDNGCGYTLLMTTQMWMRDRVGEVRSLVPARPGPSPSV